MKKFLLSLFLFHLVITTFSVSAATKFVRKTPLKKQNLDYRFVRETLNKIDYEYLYVPANGNYRVVTSASNTPFSLKELVVQQNGVAGMNGAYFDAYSKIQTSHTVRIVSGDGRTFSKWYPDTGADVVFGFLKDGTPLIVQNNEGYNHKELSKNYNSHRLGEVEYGIANFPLYLAGGKNTFVDYQKSGLITEKMQSSGPKSFICRTSDNSLKMGRVKQDRMSDMPSLLLQIGCVDALNLDNGGSMGMYDSEKYIYGPGRNIMDAFVIVKK